MSIKENRKLNKTFVAVFSATVIAATLLINVVMVTTNATGNNFSTQDNRGRKGGGALQRNKTGQVQLAEKPSSNSGDINVTDRKGNTNSSAGASAQISTNGNRNVISGNSRSKPTGANMSEQQKKNVQELIVDLQSIANSSTVTQDQVKALGNSLMVLAQGTIKPSQASVDKLAQDLADALSDGGLSKIEIQRLAEDIAAVMDSANIPQSEVQAVIEHAKGILEASSVDKGDLQEIKYDLEQIAAEIRKNIGNAKEKPAGARTGAKRKP